MELHGFGAVYCLYGGVYLEEERGRGGSETFTVVHEQVFRLQNTAELKVAEAKYENPAAIHSRMEQNSANLKV